MAALLPGPGCWTTRSERLAAPAEVRVRVGVASRAWEVREADSLAGYVIQFDEPAFNVFMDEVQEWGIAALHKAIDGLDCATAVHICYGYGIKANIDWKNTLGDEWAQYQETFPVLAASGIDQISLECAGSRVPLPVMIIRITGI